MDEPPSLTSQIEVLYRLSLERTLTNYETFMLRTYEHELAMKIEREWASYLLRKR